MITFLDRLRILSICCFLFFPLTTVTVAENIANNSMLLSNTEIETKIQALPQWTTDGKEITRTFKFKDFVTAIDFVNRLVEPAESAGHHPDLEISYNKVIVTLTTHDAGGLTPLDFELAEKISQLAN